MKGHKKSSCYENELKIMRAALEEGELSATEARKITGITLGKFRNFLTALTYTCAVYEYEENEELMLGLLRG
ncbi:MAG: hypothetical protein K6B75_06060 [Lachnospiraceae bacterium]|nr:hypothetical protein [Lachnospiraceae bacterium]